MIMKEKDVQRELDRIFNLSNEAELDEAIMDFVCNKLGWSENIINDFYHDFSQNPMMFKDAKKFMTHLL